MLIPFRPDSLILSNMKQTRRSLDLVPRNRTETFSRHVLRGGLAGLTAIAERKQEENTRLDLEIGRHADSSPCMP